MAVVGCGRVETPPEEASPETQSVAETFPEEKHMDKASFAAGPWQDAYAEFLRAPANYAEGETYRTRNFILADLDNDGSPELIIGHGNDIEGGAFFANVYSYDSNLNIIGQRVDMYYKSLWLSTDPSYPGVFVEGGRNSTFSCNYWTINDSLFVDELLWTDAYDSDVGKMVIKEVGNQLLIAEAKRVISLYPYGIEFSEIDETNIQKTIYDN